MLVIAVTGGIGSGKSTVAELFQAKGIPVIDTDTIARDLVEPGTPLLQRIIREFGQEFVDAHGRLDRRAMRELIFSDDKARNKLENMMHPLIHARVMADLARIEAPYCLLLIPLLAHSKQQYPYDRVLLIDAPEAVRVQRTSLRDRQKLEQIKQIIASQASPSELSAMADDILDNSGDLEQLSEHVDRLHQRYLEMAAAKT